MPSADHAICVDFGSTFTKASLVDLGAGERDGRRDQRDAVNGSRDRQLGQLDLVDDGVIHRPIARSVDAKSARGVALRVKIDHEHAVAREGQVAGQIDNRRGLSDAALLVGTGDRLAHSGGHPAFIHRG